MQRLPGLEDKDWDLAEALDGFTTKYLLSRYNNPKPIPALHLEMWALFFSANPMVSVAAPREHAKSTAITFAYAIFILGFRVSRHMLMIGSNEKNASAFLQEIKTEFVENEEMAKYLGFAKFRKETETELIFEWADGTKSRAIAKGAQQRMRGLKWERKRPDSVLFDDMEDEEMVLNENTRKKFLDWFQGTVRPITSDGGKIRGVGTIIGFGSFLEKTMPNEKSKHTVKEPLRTYSKVHNPGEWVSVKYRAHDPDFSNILWQEAFSKDRLLEIRASFAQLGTLDIYGQEYLNDPVDPGRSYYRKSDLLPMSDLDREKKKIYYAAADFAISESDRAAYTVNIVGGLDSDGFLHIVDVRRDRIDSLEIIEELFAINDAYHPECFGVEQENIAKSIGPFLYKKMEDDNTYINLFELKPTKDKDKRGRSMQARTRARRVKFDKTADWYPDFEEEITRYPKHQYKDQFDAFAWLGLMLNSMDEPSTPEEEEEAEYQQAYHDHNSHGRNPTTGY